MPTRAIYAPNSGAATLESYFDGLTARIKEDGVSPALDSACSTSVDLASSNEEMPALVQSIAAKMGSGSKDVARALDAVAVGMAIYEREHGVKPTGDVIEAALSQALNSYDKRALDSTSGGSVHHDQFSAQPNRAVVAITSAIAEAFPAANYLPVDIGSNEAKLIIVSHLAGSTWGGYANGALLDGINIGEPYVSAERRVQLTLAGDRLTATGKIASTVGGSGDMKLLRGRSLIFVNGFRAATENRATGGSSASSPVSGVIAIAGTDYTIGGTVNIDTGAVSLTFTPALPANTVVDAQGFADYERDPLVTPVITTQYVNYELFANPWRVITRSTIDAQTQGQNEVGLDPLSESMITVRNQFAMERHYIALNRLKKVAVNNSATYDFDYTNQKAQKTRAQIWQDFFAVLGVVDQKMAEETMDHGITHLYVTKNVAAQMMGLGREIWEPSGLVARPGIYRLGRLYGRFEVYYTPKVLTEGSTTSEILCIGRSTQVARNPIVMGDAAPPTIRPLSFGDDMKDGNAFYARCFNDINPHQPSARGAALITVSNLF